MVFNDDIMKNVKNNLEYLSTGIVLIPVNSFDSKKNI